MEFLLYSENFLFDLSVLLAVIAAFCMLICLIMLTVHWCKESTAHKKLYEKTQEKLDDKNTKTIKVQ